MRLDSKWQKLSISRSRRIDFISAWASMKDRTDLVIQLHPWAFSIFRMKVDIASLRVAISSSEYHCNQQAGNCPHLKNLSSIIHILIHWSGVACWGFVLDQVPLSLYSKSCRGITHARRCNTSVRSNQFRESLSLHSNCVSLATQWAEAWGSMNGELT